MAQDIPKTFIERAWPLVQRGYYVFPLSNPDKVPLIKDWPNMASNSGPQLVAWSQGYPDANVGCIGRYVICLDDDRGDLRERYERETGKPFPSTYTVQTSRKKTGMHGFHYHFLETAESMAVGSRALPDVFDFQADIGHQFVGPWSVHRSGHVYTPLDPKAKLVPIPADLLHWIDSVTPQPKRRQGDGPVSHEDWSPEDWLEHYSDVFVIEGTRDGWQIADICPLTWTGEGTGHRHKGSKLTGFRFDGTTPEFHCFSTDGIGDDDPRPHTEASFGDVVKHLNQYHKRYPGMIWEEEEDDPLEGFDVEDDLDEPEPEPSKPEEEEEICPRYEGDCGCGMPHLKRPKPAEEPKPEPEPEAPGKEFEVGVGNRGPGTPKQSIIGILASDVRSEPMVWLWPDKIPGSAITWLSGKPDCGKSIVSLDIIMRVTTGTDWPDGTKNTMGPRMVMLAASEDDLTKTLLPRLRASGADVTKVILVKRTLIEGNQAKRVKRQFQLKADVSLLKATLHQNPDVALVVFDPITAYWGDCDVNKDQQIRPVLEGIADACSITSASFVAIVHHNKRSDVDAIGKILGASSVSAASRAAWGFSRDPKNKGEYFMCIIKGNLAKKRDGLKYSIVDATVTLDGGEEATVPKIEWLGEHDLNADDLMAQQKKEAKDAEKDAKPGAAECEAAKKFILAELSRGPQRSTDMHRKREALTISETTYRRAYEDLHIRPVQEPGGGKWWMALDHGDLWWQKLRPEDAQVTDQEVM